MRLLDRIQRRRHYPGKAIQADEGERHHREEDIDADERGE
jgi:hypothetical protein